MSHTMYWLQLGGCGGDTMSLLGAESPDLPQALGMLDVEVLWHPSLSATTAQEHRELVESLTAGERQLDLLCVEGAVIRGPGGTGMYDTVEGKPKKDLLRALSERARFVVAVGTCAAYGGITATGNVEASGVQFTREQVGGFVGPRFVSAGGLPVINLAGCPCHCDIVIGAVAALTQGRRLDLDEANRPEQYYGMLVHQGCVRNEYHEYRVEERDFGERGCLFFHMGCKAPLTHGPCNKLRWNRRSSKTAVGVPCGGCTEPSFPRPDPFFRSRGLAGIPVDLPIGVDRAHYLAYKSMAAAAAPDRLRRRRTMV